MIRTVSRIAPKFTGKEEIVVLPRYRGDDELRGLTKKLDVLCRSAIGESFRQGRFRGETGETLLVAVGGARAPGYVLLLGLGRRSKAGPERIARAAGSASRYIGAKKFKTCHVLLEGLVDESVLEPFVQPFLKGFLLAQYRFFLGKKRTREAGIRKLVLMADTAPSFAATVRRTRIIVKHTARVRDLVNTPANLLTPTRLAEEARSLAKENGIYCRVMRPRDIEKLGMGAVVSVAKGSHEEPRLIEMHYNKGRKGLKKVCLVGKAVTFDSGGISIKPWQNMNEMKGDMAGGALVLEAVSAAAFLKLPIEIIGLIPCVENMPDGSALRPGDVITTYSGKTIEILSTDAEGRLILADALAYATEFKPDLIVDFATLTGAVVIALGKRIAGVMGNNQGFIDRLVAAGAATGERVWQLPLDEDFSRAVKGNISDYKNYSGRDGSTITAAALLGEFVGSTPWMHVDIAGTFWSEGGKVPYHSKGGTGFGVDLTVRFLQSLSFGT